MYFSEEKLNRIFDKTSGYCVFCGIQLAWDNYGKICARGGWEVEHGNPASRGGINDLRNLNPACMGKHNYLHHLVSQVNDFHTPTSSFQSL